MALMAWPSHQAPAVRTGTLGVRVVTPLPLSTFVG